MLKIKDMGKTARCKFWQRISGVEDVNQGRGDLRARATLKQSPYCDAMNASSITLKCFVFMYFKVGVVILSQRRRPLIGPALMAA